MLIRLHRHVGRKSRKGFWANFCKNSARSDGFHESKRSDVAAGVGAAEFNPGGGLLLPHHFASSLGRGELAKVFLKPRPHPTPLYPLGLFVVVESYLCNVFLFFPVLKDV